MDYLSHSSARPLSFIVHLLAVATVVLLFVWTYRYRGGLAYSPTRLQLLFNVHPVMMTLAFILLSSEAVLVYKTLPGSKNVRKAAHLVLQFAAFALAVVGLCAVFEYHDLSGIANVYSLHSWLGLITVALFGLQWLLGFVAYVLPGFPIQAKAFLLPWHVFFGLVIYGLALVSIELGLLERLTFLERGSVGRFSSEAILVNFIGLIIVVLGVFVYMIASIPNIDPHFEREPGYSAITM